MRDCFHGAGNVQFFHGASHIEVIPSLSCFTFPCSTGQCSRYLDMPELILGLHRVLRKGGMSWDLRSCSGHTVRVGKDKWHSSKKEERRVDTH